MTTLSERRDKGAGKGKVKGEESENDKGVVRKKKEGTGKEKKLDCRLLDCFVRLADGV